MKRQQSQEQHRLQQQQQQQQQAITQEQQQQYVQQRTERQITRQQISSQQRGQLGRLKNRSITFLGNHLRATARIRAKAPREKLQSMDWREFAIHEVFLFVSHVVTFKITSRRDFDYQHMHFHDRFT